MEEHSSYVTVMVLGDVGRSPRMQYHCLSLVENGFDVSLVGFVGKDCCDDVENNDHIKKYLINGSVFQGWPRYLFPIYAPLKVFLLLYTLLFVVPRPRYYLVQNPPSVPALIIAWIMCKIQRAKFIIDWHNLGYTILGLSLGRDHILTRLYKFIEKTFGQKGDGHLCVTKAMKKWLKDEWGIEANVLYDKSSEQYHRCSLQEQHQFYKQLQTIVDFSDLTEYQQLSDREHETLFTTDNGQSIVPSDHKPFLLVSSTSWTPDEDFGILFQALQQLDEQLYKSSREESRSYPPILCVITGTGPLRDYYQALFKQSHFHFVHIYTATLSWLSFSDYASLLGSADIGVSLHTSSSGLDLPMKVVDMFGASLPVCAKDFPALPELVQDSKNGYTFNTSDELCELLYKVVNDQFSNGTILPTLREGIQPFLESRWSKNWNQNAKQLFI